jgi:hypothetical protein
MDMFNNYFNQPQQGGMMPQQQNGYVPYGMPFGGIPGYQQQYQAPKMHQLLSPEEINTLRQTGQGFSINIDPKDVMKSLCTHKYNGQYAVNENKDGTYTCAICGATFKPIDLTKEEVEAIVRQTLDILDTIKLMFADMPIDMGREYFPMMELIKKIPEFYQIAHNNFEKYTTINSYSNPQNQYGNAFYNLSMATGGGFNNYGMPMMAPQPAPMYDPNQMNMYQQQPMMQPQQGMNMYQQQPQGMNNGYSTVTPQQNPFTNSFYQQPMMQPQQQMNMYQPQTMMQPQQQMAPSPIGAFGAPMAPQTQTQPTTSNATDNTVSVTKTLEV